ncbi:MAG: hypothetical protein J7L82_06255 [Staphylothermus sp.]|nr:hypothetical protein [Staphylothermus sp.]
MLGYEIKCLLNDNMKCIEIMSANIVGKELSIDNIFGDVLITNVVIIPDMIEYEVRIWIKEELNKIIFSIYEIKELGKLGNGEIQLIRNDILCEALGNLALTYFYEKETARRYNY